MVLSCCVLGSTLHISYCIIVVLCAQLHAALMVDSCVTDVVCLHGIGSLKIVTEAFTAVSVSLMCRRLCQLLCLCHLDVDSHVFVQLRGAVANLKARLSDAATKQEKQKMIGCDKRKNLVADNRALSSKLVAMTASHGRLRTDLVQMTGRWKSLEQQVTDSCQFCFD